MAVGNEIKNQQLDHPAAECASNEDSGEFEYEEEACELDDANVEELDDAINLLGGAVSDQQVMGYVGAIQAAGFEADLESDGKTPDKQDREAYRLSGSPGSAKRLACRFKAIRKHKSAISRTQIKKKQQRKLRRLPNRLNQEEAGLINTSAHQSDAAV